ncbi:polyprenyl synthetase family protein [Leucobacter chromiiresistens]|uniref:Geranylgeranyl diphosphate synthase, type II n=1 Tax=Leucobacter chromiiresistens TaxID=1079994 RepID=A0A1H0YM26_9MICO|nr:polyprenyl synthetase family protein [Leucobacter chromiiresistens]SDQ15906.1 geranylgeranyl diphosphate synthase, type II [Leucobacter chromiiresistens]
MSNQDFYTSGDDVDELREKRTAPGTHAPPDAAERVSLAISEAFDRRTRAAEAYHPVFAQLWKICGERVAGGKRIRPRLMLDMLTALSDDAVPEAAVEIAAAIELLHASFLLHDDVFDGDLTRRGSLNLVGLLATDEQTDAAPSPQRLHWARSCGILMGDLLLAEVHQIFARVDVDPESRTRLLDLLAHAITESVVGEQLDIGLEDGAVVADTATVLEMCRLKTATYTFELPLRAAAILAGSASPAAESALATAGAHLGLAFQLQDDLLSTFGDPAAHGKDAFSDLREGKETAVISAARMTSAWPEIEPAFGTGTLTGDAGERMRGLLRDCGAEAFVHGLIDDQMRALHETLADPASGLPDAARDTLVALAGRLDGRRS